MNYENEPHVLRTKDGRYVAIPELVQDFTQNIDFARVFPYQVYMDMWAGERIDPVLYEKALKLEEAVCN